MLLRAHSSSSSLVLYVLTPRSVPDMMQMAAAPTPPNTKPHVCSTCGMAFGTSSALSRHLLVPHVQHGAAPEVEAQEEGAREQAKENSPAWAGFPYSPNLLDVASPLPFLNGQDALAFATVSSTRCHDAVPFSAMALADQVGLFVGFLSRNHDAEVWLSRPHHARPRRAPSSSATRSFTVPHAVGLPPVWWSPAGLLERIWPDCETCILPLVLFRCLFVCVNSSSSIPSLLAFFA